MITLSLKYTVNFFQTHVYCFFFFGYFINLKWILYLYEQNFIYLRYVDKQYLEQWISGNFWFLKLWTDNWDTLVLVLMLLDRINSVVVCTAIIWRTFTCLINKSDVFFNTMRNSIKYKLYEVSVWVIVKIKKLKKCMLKTSL